MTRSELIAMGFDKDIVEGLPSYDDLQFTTERIARFNNIRFRTRFNPISAGTTNGSAFEGHDNFSKYDFSDSDWKDFISKGGFSSIRKR